MLKVDITKVRAQVKYDIERRGSVLAGTVKASLPKVISTYDIESAASAEEVARVIRAARAGCFVRAALTESVEMEDHTAHNGTPIDIESGKPLP